MTTVLSLFRSTADGVCAVDDRQRIVLWNEAAETLLGYQASDAIGRSCFEVLGGCDEEGYELCRRGCPFFDMARRDRIVPTRTIGARTKDGDALWLSVSTILVPARWRAYAVLVHLLRDVSRAKLMEDAVEQLVGSVAAASAWTDAAPPRGDGASDGATSLTRRELEVLRLLASGKSTGVIADTLMVSVSTVRNHVHGILAKLGVHSRLEAVAAARQIGVLDLG